MRAARCTAAALPIAVLLALAACAPGAPPPETPPPGTTAAAPPAEPATGWEAPGAPPPEPLPEAAREGAGAATAPAVPLPGGDEPAQSGPLRLRVGLASDLERVELPCCSPHWVLEAGGETVPLDAPAVVEPGVDPADRGVYRLQVAALRDAAGAAELAARLGERWGWPADAHFDAGVGLYRVRAGAFADRPTAERAQRRLQAAGTDDTWIVTEGSAVADPALRLVRDGRSVRVPGRWLRLVGGGDSGLPYGDLRLRGDLLVHLNPRGTLNVINEIHLEDYLRGVVPAEMGPVQYDRLEALKAQAVAARTYTLRNLGGFRDEGYDICATPRCQVYGGLAAEHPLSDRAVEATAGVAMMYRGGLVDARYSATCGGHTEDVAVVFPDERAPYLRGVPCIEGGGEVLEGDAAEGAAFPAALTLRLLPAPAGAAPAAALSLRLRELAARAGLPRPAPAQAAGLRSTARRDVRRYVGTLFDLALGPRVLLAADDLPHLAQAPPDDWSTEERRQAVRLVESGLYDGGEELVEGAAAELLLFQLARVAGVLADERASFRAVERGGAGRRLHVMPRGGGGERALLLPAALPTFRRRADGTAVATDLLLLPGDPLTLWSVDGRPVAVVHEVPPSAAPADPEHRRAAWTRYHGQAELARRVEERYPGLGFTGFDVLRRGVSGRVGAIRLHGRERSVVVEGLAVRWTLDVPDTRFTARRVGSGWRFTGRGWGHGVGLCQAGSFAMAGRDLSYRDILYHYYSGIELARVRTRAALWDEPPPVPATVAAGR